MKGTVARFYFKKGFGFITGEDGVEYFFHYSDFDGEKRDIANGVAVTFNPEQREKGPGAVAVRIVDAKGRAQPAGNKRAAGTGTQSSTRSGIWGPLIAGFLLGTLVGGASVLWYLGRLF